MEILDRHALYTDHNGQVVYQGDEVHSRFFWWIPMTTSAGGFAQEVKGNRLRVSNCLDPVNNPTSECMYSWVRQNNFVKS